MTDEEIKNIKENSDQISTSKSQKSTDSETSQHITESIICALKTVYDPEIPADVYELGLIYRIEINDDHHVTIDMTLTAPACPVAGEMPKWVEDAVSAVPGIQGVTVNMVFDPPWDQSRLSDEARIALNMW
jgi:FeS assembly SUF system protein